MKLYKVLYCMFLFFFVALTAKHNDCLQGRNKPIETF